MLHQFTPIRTAIILIVTVLGIFLAIPNFFSKETTANWPSFLPHDGMTLGLDLQGGSHLLLQVNRESIITERLKGLRRDARQLLAGERGIGNIITTEADGITVELTDPSTKEAARTALETMQTNISSTLGIGGTPELEFGETADGKLAVKLTERRRHRAHVVADRAIDRSHPQACRRSRHDRADHPAPGAGSGAGSGPRL